MAHPKKTDTKPGAEPQLADLVRLTQADFELAFFGAILDRHPNYLEVLKAHAGNLAETKRIAESVEVDRLIIALRPDDARTHYNMACGFALMKKRDEALATLRRALELGYRDFRFIRNDTDLASIRNHPGFSRLLAEFERD